MYGYKELNEYNKFPSYKGGDTLIYGGYVWEYCPTHRLSNNWGWVSQHRLVAEEKLGRPLIQDKNEKISECVHHINEIRTDNSPENLLVMNKTEHRRHHARIHNQKFLFPLTREQVQKALEETGGIKPAARLLGCDGQTIRNRFPDLLKPYVRKSPTKIEYFDDLSTIKSLAEDNSVSLRDASMILGMAIRTIGRICERHGYEWVKKTRMGEVHRTYRKKPTQSYLELCERKIELANQ